MSVEVTRIDACRCRMGEGPVWDVEEQALYFIDIRDSKVHRYRPDDGTVRSWETPLPPGALALRERGGAILAMRDRVAALSFESGQFREVAIADDQPETATFNDGKVDRQGRFVIGSGYASLRNPMPVGGIFSLAPQSGIRRVEEGITFSNGPCFSVDGRTFYFADSAEHSIYAYDYDVATGCPSRRRLFADTRALGGLPDGSTVDSEGRVWSAIFRGGKVAAFAPDGTIDRVIDLPVSLVSSVMFGGPSLDRLFVTTIDPACFGEPLADGAGYIYVIDGLGVRGLPEPRYAG
jgi:L-arabinonolactonase